MLSETGRSDSQQPCRNCAQNEASLCQGVMLGVRLRVGWCRCRRRVGAGLSLAVGPGTDSPKCRCSGFCRPRWIPESPLIVVPGPLSTGGAGVDL